MTADTPTVPARRTVVPWIVVIAGVAITILGVVFAGRFGEATGVSPSPLIGAPVPAVELPYFEREGTLVLDELDGEILVVNFWASWCLACRVEHDALVTAAAAYEDFDVRFVGVLYQDQARRGSDFLDELGRSARFDYVIDDDSRAALEFGVLGLPETFFVDREGTIVGKVSGPVSLELLAQTIDQIALGRTVGEVVTGEVENLGS